MITLSLNCISNQQHGNQISNRFRYLSARKDQQSWLNLPNSITLTRIAASPLLTLFIAYDYKEYALLGCLLAAISDWLDGYIAKNYNMKTVLGAFLDPLADKIFIGSLSVGLHIQGLLPFPLVAVIIGRDLLLMTGSLYLRATEKDKDAPFFDTTYSATFVIMPSNLSKLNTGCQFVLLISTLSSYVFSYPTLNYLVPLWWISGFTTVASGLGYLNKTGIKHINVKKIVEKTIRKKNQ